MANNYRKFWQSITRPCISGYTLRDAWKLFPVNVVHFGGKKATASLKKAFYRKSTRNPMSSTEICSICMLALFFTRAQAVGTTPKMRWVFCCIMFRPQENAWTSSCLQHELPWTHSMKILFDKAIQLSVIAHDMMKSHFKKKNCRSRYEKFLYLTRHTRTHAVRVRDREPSRIPRKKISSILQKSRNVRTCVKKNIPRSSRMHMFINECRVHVRSVHKRKIKFHSSAVKRIKYKCVLSSKRMHRKYRKHRMKLKTNYYLNKLMKSSSASNVLKIWIIT